MLSWLNSLSLRWKFMLAPAIGVAMMVALAGILLELRLKQDAFLERLQSVDFQRVQRVLELNNRLADNHGQIYELLRLAEQETDEGAFYDAGKPRLNEIHRIEARLQDELDGSDLIDAETDLFASLLTHIAEYRITITNALLTATVDLTLARNHMTTSSRQFNSLNAELLVVSQALQHRLDRQLATHKEEINRQTWLVAGLFIAIVAFMLVLSGTLSHILSRDLRGSIANLGHLVARQVRPQSTELSSTGEIAMLAETIEGVRETQAYLQKTREELDETNQQLSRSNETILRRERILEKLNENLEEKIEELNATIAERDEAQAALRQAQRLEAVGKLTGGIAHDFNNLLAAMVGNAEMLEDLAGGDEKARHNVGAIIKSVERGAALTQRLLAFSRKQPLSPQPTAVNDLIHGLETLLQRSLGETIDLRMAVAANRSVALIDPHQFENALVNLAINARDAMPDGGSLTIATAETNLDAAAAGDLGDVAPGHYVRITVSDSGEGMAPEVLEKAFDPFFTTKDVGKGSGLGLSMVYGFVKQSNGHIAVRSRPGDGTTVEILVPRSDLPAAQEESPAAAAELHPGSERILLVEDDEDIREVTAAILAGQGYHVIDARSGREALKKLQAGSAFALLFTDMVLPGGMNGLEIAEEARRLQPDIKVLFTSGYASNSVAKKRQIEFGDSLISKPYRRAELLQRVRAILDDGAPG